MTTKEYLKRPFELSRLIRIRAKQIQSISSLIYGTSIALSGIPRSDSPNPHREEELIAKRIDLENELSIAKINYEKAIIEVAQAINSINNPTCEEVLTARYLCFKDWTTIARELDYSKDWLYCLHRKGLNLVKIE